MIFKGQRVMTKPFGPGTVVGFEHFSSDGKKSFIGERTHELSSSRVVVQLDKPELWMLSSESHPHPYMLRSDFVDDFKENQIMSATHALRVVYDVPNNNRGNAGPGQFVVLTTSELADLLANSFRASLTSLRHIDKRPLTAAERKENKERMDEWDMESFPV